MSTKKKNNFIKPNQAHKQKAWWKSKWFISTAAVISALVIVGILLYVIYKDPAQEAYSLSLEAEQSLSHAQDSLLEQDFDAAATHLEAAKTSFTQAQNRVQSFIWLKSVPWLGTQVSAVSSLLTAGTYATNSIIVINDLAHSITEPISDSAVSLNDLSDKQTEQILGAIYEAKPELEKAQASILDADATMAAIPQGGLLKPVQEAVVPVREKIGMLVQGIDQAIAASQIVPVVAGYPEQQTYLFLLQNNHELRPTGGFIGTYGILKIKNGDIVSFNTDNVYNLDEPSAEWMTTTPPWPLNRYNAVTTWFFRDANWSPDFPTAAKKALELYYLERGPEKNIDGVIAVTPTFIQSLMELTGDIPVNGISFTPDTFIDTLQYQVEQGYLRQGIADSERKEIIGILSDKILEKILDLPRDQWPDLWNVFKKDISEKQILIYLENSDIQAMVEHENWGGHIRESDGDFVAVFDANLASLKTDQVMDRAMEYTVQRDGKNIIADLYITYTNTGEITWKTTRYRTYTRVLAPQGSHLLKAEGMMVDCKLADEGSVETTDAYGKTIFGTFICIEPGETKSLHFKYSLPKAIYNQFSESSVYDLIWQKQPGTDNYPFSISVDMDDAPTYIESIDKFEIMKDNSILVQGDLSLDRDIEIQY